MAMAVPTITLEEHFVASNAQDILPASAAKFLHPWPQSEDWISRLKDISPSGPRLQAMNAGNVGIQILSHPFHLSSCAVDAVMDVNNELYAATRAQSRFKGFAALPMRYPHAAAAELERCVKQLGFVGALIDAHLSDGRYYDDSFFWDVFAKAQELDVPIYIHPTNPTDNIQASLYEGNYDMHMGITLGIAGWGWHCDAALSLLRLYAAGVFQRFPNLKIIIGHMGELIPFQLERIDEKLSQGVGNTSMSFREVWNRNIWVTTSGMFTLPPMTCLLQTTSVEKILYSVDYPFSDPRQGDRFLKELESSGLVSREQLAMIAYKNAEKLLKLS